ncbi:Gfo/Idh/MocA family oxidoreductase [Evansella sp. AB-P1]|uniref:Gfo/Idh/MocA family protein n=1 Tax=Evansella sp. AB-P1 TaxID=3037653 RepID=UPI00241D31C3|nr:Gfo/Idh/MocA family oxidoreductase [Evansella sp. AB-P1]MDG5787218.1 Gfo/Idh/MocA family oxidoreductase [Evansella sp. AB-P1]
MIKVAVVGVNKIGYHHCRFYDEHPDVQLVSVCDLDEERANRVGETFNVSSYTDLSTLLEKEEIHVVSIATSGVENGSHHYEPAMLAITAGKDVLVEKPLSNSLQEARDMVQHAKAYGVRLGCNMNHRFVPAAYKGKELIEKGELGNLLFVNMKLTIKSPKDQTPWFHMRALHPHSVDVMSYFAGDVRRVQSFMTKAPGRNIWSTVSINVEFENGAVGHLTGSYDMSKLHPIEYCEVAGDKGRFEIDNIYEKFTFYPHESDEILTLRNSIMSGVATFRETFRNRIYHFIDEIKQGIPPENIIASGTEALAVQEVIEAAILSQKANGAVVDLSEVREVTEKI